MIVGSDGFAHLHRFLSLCDVDVGEFGGHGRDGEQRVQLFTEYSFVESRYTEADVHRFPDAPPDNDTPDVVLLGEDWLLAVEAKMFHAPSITALNAQVARQKVILDYLARTLRLPPERVRHVLLLPALLASDGAAVPVVTWESVLVAWNSGSARGPGGPVAARRAHGSASPCRWRCACTGPAAGSRGRRPRS